MRHGSQPTVAHVPTRSPATWLLACIAILASTGCALVLDFQDARDKQMPSALTSTDANETDAAAPGEDASANDLDGGTPAPASGGGLPDASPDADDGGVGSGAAEIAIACVPMPPSGWNGPLAIFEANTAATDALPGCAGAYEAHFYDGLGSLAGASAACSCTCEKPSGVGCSPPQLSLYADARCNQVSDTGQSLAAAPSCTRIGLGAANALSYAIGSTTPFGGGCQPRATQQVAPPTWGSSVRLCTGSSSAKPAAACAPNEVAAPQTRAPFEAGNHCIARPGNWACPSGYPNGRSYAQSAIDTRDCTACTCGAPTGASCAATTFTDDRCTSGAKPAGACERTQSARSASFSGAATGGVCAPEGGTPTGTVVPAAPMTICCTM
jgi:hypothetical protein